MINKIKEYITKHKKTTHIVSIYEKLKEKYNEHDIKFTLLTYFDTDIELEMRKGFHERENRYYQQMLRQQAFERYDNKCLISGIDEELLLEVAHIKPVSECKTENEKSDINNVLLLWIDIHKFFDAYQVSINPNTTKVEVKCDYLSKYDNKKIKINEKTKEYLKYHYEKFKENDCK